MGMKQCGFNMYVGAEREGRERKHQERRRGADRRRARQGGHASGPIPASFPPQCLHQERGVSLLVAVLVCGDTYVKPGLATPLPAQPPALSLSLSHSLEEQDLVIVVGVKNLGHPARAQPDAPAVAHGPSHLLPLGALTPDPGHDVPHQGKPL